MELVNFVCNHKVAALNSVGLLLTIAGVLLLFRYGMPYQKSRLRESAQGDKWSFCLTAGKIGPRIRREHEQKTAPEPCIGL